ncbi:EAL domain-containing protein [Geomonas sp. Red69]|nr:EAL domain-containing protein [Geomonas diazotrophica]QXE86828.1 EAL domain-containing protein [Geomonas nitrogeniifigens]
MKYYVQQSQLAAKPLAVFGLLLLVTFGTEAGVMALLSRVFPGLQGLAATLTDALLLTALSAPAVWWLVVRPLRGIALQASAKADAVLRSITDAVITFDCDGTIDSLNPAAESIFGYPPHHMEGEHIGLILPEVARWLPGAAGAPAPPGQALYAANQSCGRHRDGTVFPVEVSLGRLARQKGRRFIAIVHDIRQLKQALAAAQEQQEFLGSLLQQSAVPIFVLDPERRVLIWNRACEELTGRSAREMVGTDRAWQAFYPEEHPVLAEVVISGDLERARGGYSSVRQSVLIPEGLHAEGWYQNLNGQERYIMFEAAPIQSGSGKLLAVIESLEDITQRKRYEEQLEYQANYDSLTGLVNRNLLADRMKQALLMSRRRRHEVALFMLDLDGFQLVNDTLGQEAGDTVLRLVAERLAGCVRAEDTVARYSGDEFVVLIADRGVSDSAAVIAVKLQEAIARPLNLKGQELTVTAGIGISIYPRDGDEMQTLLGNAEAAMYRAKETGRHSFRFYTAQMNERSLARITLENHLRRALDRGEFVLHYQPKVSLPSGQIVGMEALLRWDSPELGSVPPDAFIPLAEENGLIIPIGTWVLRTACAQNKAWYDAGFPALSVAVNLSPRQFRQQDITAVIAEALAETGLPPHLLELEITESMVMQDATRVASVLNELKRMGASLAMDDFGTGYSSLAYLKRFPFDKLKIDKSFVIDITTDPNNAAIAKAVIAMAHSLHLKVIAEGVETQGQLNYLHDQGCDEIQGYFVSRPVAAGEFMRLLQGQPIAVPSHAAGYPDKTVLVVDDDEGVLNALQRMLFVEGYNVLSASGADEAFALLALNRVAVVISDFRMPGMNGAEFLGRVKELYPETVRIMLSGYADIDAVTNAVNLGAIYKVMYKPWSEPDLRENLEEAFRHYSGVGSARSAASQPPFVFEINQHPAGEHEAEGEHGRVAVGPFQLRHLLEVHAVPPHHEGKRHEDGRDDGQNLHHLVEPVGDAGKVDVEHPREHLAQRLQGVEHLDDMVVEVAQVDDRCVADQR